MVLRESHLENPANLASGNSGRLPKLARNGRADLAGRCLLLGDERTWSRTDLMVRGTDRGERADEDSCAFKGTG
jgi:hypothetical protein